MKTYFYKAIIEPAEEGGYTAYVPKLTGCVSEGETYEEAMANMREALTLYLEVAKERNQEIVEDNTHTSRRWPSLCEQPCGAHAQGIAVAVSQALRAHASLIFAATSSGFRAMAYPQVPNLPSALTAFTQRWAACALMSARSSNPFVSRTRCQGGLPFRRMIKSGT